MDVAVEMEIRPVAFVTLDERSYELISSAQVSCPIQWETELYFGFSVDDAQWFPGDVPEIRELLAAIIAEAKRRSYDGYLLVRKPS
jgi:hypothetical protein